jgi:hypothetical protein
MTRDDGLKDEMPMPPSRREVHPDPPALDDRTAQRLLAGRLDRAETPPEYAGVAELLGAAAAPPAPDELAGEDAALAAFRSAMAPTPMRASRSRPRRPRRVSLKLAAAVVIVVLSLAGAAGAATGTLPDPAQRVVHKVLGVAGVPGPDHSKTTERNPATTHGSKPRGGPGAPGSTGPAGNGPGHGRGQLAPPTTRAERGRGEEQGQDAGNEPEQQSNGQGKGTSNAGGNGKGQENGQDHGPQPKPKPSRTAGND